MFDPENVERTEWRHADYEGWYPEPDPSPDETWRWEKPIYTVPATAFDQLLALYREVTKPFEPCKTCDIPWACSDYGCVDVDDLPEGEANV